MSQSRPLIGFPYCTYPYTFGQKCWFYFARGCQFTMNLIGVGIYSSFVRRSPLLAPGDLNTKTIEELEIATINLRQNSLKHLFGTFVPCILACNISISSSNYYFNYFIQNYGKYLQWIKYLAEFATIIGAYNIMSNFYNSLTCQMQIGSIKHGQQIARAINAIKKDFREMDDTRPDVASIGDNIYREINENKLSWKIFRNEDDGGQLSYVISNNYYEHLIFVFNVYNTALEFMKELEQLNIYEIDAFAENKNKCREARNTFIKRRLCDSLLYDYYVFANDTQQHKNDIMYEQSSPFLRNKSELQSLMDSNSQDSHSFD